MAELRHRTDIILGDAWALNMAWTWYCLWSSKDNVILNGVVMVVSMVLERRVRTAKRHYTNVMCGVQRMTGDV